MAQTLRWLVTQSHPMTLEQFLRTEKQISRRLLTKLKRTGGLWCNGSPIRSIDLVNYGDVVELILPEAAVQEANAGIMVPVVLETPHFIVYDKPPHMPVHPSQNHYTDTLGNCFAAAYPGMTYRPVNRLDRDTSGLCVVAKSSYAASQLQYGIQKVYYAIVEGEIAESGTVNAPIAREQESIIIRCVREDGKAAVTHYTPLWSNGKHTLVRLKLETGRTHQIRVHMAYIGHPLAGDEMYGGRMEGIKRQALHCGRMVFGDVEGERCYCVGCAMPADMQALTAIKFT